MAALVPDIEAYGKYARASALADYIELLAVAETPTRKARLADYIGDNDWKLQDLVLPIGVELAEAPGARDPSEAADLVFSLLGERAELLGAKYPFEIQGARLVKRAGLVLEEDPYIALLAIATCHAYELPVPEAAHQVFEETVAGVLRARSLDAVNFGVTRRECANFEEALKEACDDLGLAADPSSVPRMRRAQDENVDIICKFQWGDGRPGQWTAIGQVTVGKSEHWELKIKEASPNLWYSLISVLPRPRAFLAIPHHAESLWLSRLVYDSENILLDRIRLVKYKDDTSPSERALIDVLDDTDIEEP